MLFEIKLHQKTFVYFIIGTIFFSDINRLIVKTANEFYWALILGL
jgi:hypothetical protein